MKFVLIFLIAYFIGNISASYLVSKVFYNEDIRDKGSGNAGTTNVLRNYGFKYALMTFLIDFLKGTLAAFIGSKIDPNLGAYIAGVSVVLGHVWPVVLKFKGGKGVATTAGVYLFTDYRIFLVQFILFISINILGRLVSLTSLIISVIATSLVVLLHSGNTYFIVMSLINSLLIFYKHKDNIKRLMAGTESKLDLNKFKPKKGK